MRDSKRLVGTSVIVAAFLFGGAAAAFVGCGSSGDDSTFSDGGSSGVLPEADPPLGGDSGPHTHNDFPTPVFDTTDGGVVPSNAPDLFGPATQGAATGGPCLVEPEVGALYPRNWLRPRFRWNAPAGENLFELRIHADNQVSDLVVYTESTTWTMPQNLWDELRTDSNDVPMTVAIRGGTLNGAALDGESLGSNAKLGVAPADAPGTIVYWTTSDGTSLKGFQVGDETVGTTLQTGQVQEVQLDGGGHCLGCHVGTPDGDFASFSTDVGGWSNAFARIDPDGGAIGAAPTFLGAGAQATLAAGPLGINTVSKAHWSTGDHTMIASNGSDLVWVDLEATDVGSARGVLTRTGTQASGTLAGGPTWSHDGTTIVYVATNHLDSGRLGGDFTKAADPGSTADLYMVPYNARAGGAIAPIPGANDPAMLDYYPSFAPDDAYLAYDKTPNDTNMYNQPQAEVYVIPRAGGTPTRLAANDPPACSAIVSPGVTNSWPKWAPAVTKTTDGRSFYWIVFSSTRAGSLPQLFISGMVVDGTGAVTTSGALYLWNQPGNEGNHTPAWEYFNVPNTSGGPH